jgi:hypothetical protein
MPDDVDWNRDCDLHVVDFEFVNPAQLQPIAWHQKNADILMRLPYVMMNEIEKLNTLSVGWIWEAEIFKRLGTVSTGRRAYDISQRLSLSATV